MVQPSGALSSRTPGGNCSAIFSGLLSLMLILRSLLLWRADRLRTQRREERQREALRLASHEMRRPLQALLLAVVAEVIGYFAPETLVWRAAGLAVAAVAIWLAGFDVYKKGLMALRRGRLNINALMTVAVTGAFVIGQWPEAAMVMALYAIAEAIEARDPFTGGHCKRLAGHCEAAARYLGLPAASQHKLRLAAYMHDVGKISVPDAILMKPGPLTTEEYIEWGNPNKADEYAWMRAYSPYDNLEAKDYPSTLVRTGFNDSQVMYWEPAKYVARKRRIKTDSNPLLFITDLSSGHGGASGRYDAMRDLSWDYTWLCDQLDVKI